MIMSYYSSAILLTQKGNNGLKFNTHRNEWEGQLYEDGVGIKISTLKL